MDAVMAPAKTERKGLRFEVEKRGKSVPVFDQYDSPWQEYWTWTLIGAGNTAYATAPQEFHSEAAARSHIAKVRSKLKSAGFAKVITVEPR